MHPVFKIRSSRVILCIAFVTAVCLAVILYGRWHVRHPPNDINALRLLSEAYSAVLVNYVEKPDSKKLVLKMVDGMLATLDPHSAYLPPEPYHEMEVSLSGSFGRGEKGKPITLTIIRAENARPLVFNLVRDIIKLKSLKSKLLDSGYGFIRISQFQERTGSEFKEALRDLHAKSGGSLKGLILDLRYNPGGLINSCVEVVNCFVGDDINNTAIVSIKGRAPEANHVYNGTLGTKEPRYPIVVLINGGSASASEIVAGALQDHKRAIIMGTQSFGKGSVQSIFPMKGNAALKLTTARYYTPSGRSIQAKGIVPDIEVAAIKQEATQLQLNRPEIKEKDLDNRLAPSDKVDEPQPKTPDSAKGPSVDQELQKDFQLRRAVELLQSLSLLQERGLTTVK